MITSEQLKSKRKYAIVGAFVLAAILTPPDVLSQMSLAGPLLLLYQGSIWSVRIVEKKKAKADAEAAAGKGGGSGDGPEGGPEGGPAGGSDGGTDGGSEGGSGDSGEAGDGTAKPTE